MLDLEKIAIEQNKLELDHVLINLIGLNSHDRICTNVFNHLTTTVDNDLKVASIFSNLEPERLVCDACYYDKTAFDQHGILFYRKTYQLTDQ